MTKHIHPSGLQQTVMQGHAYDRARREAEFRLGWPGFDSLRPSLDILSFDHSGSVTAPGGTDPIGNRFREAAQAIDSVRKWTTTNRPKVAVIHFDQPSGGNSGIVRLRSRGSMRRINESLSQPPDAVGTSDLAPSLTEAEKLAAQCVDHDVRLTIFSDFALTDHNTDAVYERLAMFPGRVHAVVLNIEPPPQLRAPRTSVTRVNHQDTPGALAEALRQSLIVNRRHIAVGAETPHPR